MDLTVCNFIDKEICSPFAGTLQGVSNPQQQGYVQSFPGRQSSICWRCVQACIQKAQASMDSQSAARVSIIYLFYTRNSVQLFSTTNAEFILFVQNVQ
jgi:hypothetical protein